MATINFPASPTLNQIHDQNGRRWQWNGRFWRGASPSELPPGFTGSAGPQGFTGSAGEFGFTGSQGLQGFTGSAALDGVAGFTGSQGYSGSQGDVGFTGSAGVDGTIGRDGYTGSAGLDGTVGYTGSIGFTGSLGESSFTYSDAPPATPAVGDRWFDSAVGAELVWTTDGDSSQWVEVSASGFLGRTGYTGSAGFGSLEITNRTYTGNGTTDTFTVTTGLTTTSALVFLNGIMQTPVANYSITGTALRFIIPPANGAVIQIRELLNNIPTVDEAVSKTTATALALVFGF